MRRRFRCGFHREVAGEHRQVANPKRSCESDAAGLDPTFFFPPLGYAWFDIHEGKIASAISWLKKSKDMGAPSFVSAFLGYAYGISGDHERALAEIEEQRKTSRRAYVPAFNLAVVHLGLGETVKALDMLEKAYEANSQWLPWLRNDRVFDGLRKGTTIRHPPPQAAF